ncbi:hypothetical protein FQA39_LY15832 [Lamprigera yunnana]|nr:hypothetical protein FQA39_LY15832 [Lamprigera yunnana]
MKNRKTLKGAQCYIDHDLTQSEAMVQKDLRDLAKTEVGNLEGARNNKRNGKIQYQGYVLRYSGVNSINRANEGVGIITQTNLEKYVVEAEALNSSYSLIENDKREFYSKLQEVTKGEKLQRTVNNKERGEHIEQQQQPVIKKRTDS